MKTNNVNIRRRKRGLAFLLMLALLCSNLTAGIGGTSKVYAEGENATTDIGADVSEDASTTSTASDGTTLTEASEDSETSETTTESEEPTTETVLTGIRIKSAPEKVEYKKQLDCNAIELEGIYQDQDDKEQVIKLSVSDCKLAYSAKGSDDVVDDITKLGNALGKFQVYVTYLKQEGLETQTFSVNVVPATPQNVKQTAAKNNSVTLTWDPVEGAVGYQLVMYNTEKDTWNWYAKGGPTENNIPTNSVEVKTAFDEYGTACDLDAGSDYVYKVRAFYGVASTEKDPDSVFVSDTVVYSDLTDEIVTSTSPEKVVTFEVKSTTATKVNLTWTAVSGATGYIVKRRHTTTEAWVNIGVAQSNSYQDQNLPNATTYYYRVIAYRSQEAFCSGDSGSVKCSTAPAKVTLGSVKGGESRLRVKWKKAASATGYHVFVKKTGESEYTQVADVKQGTYQYVKTGVVNGVSYDVRVEAYREIAQINQPTVMLSFVGSVSSEKSVKPVAVKATSTKAKLFSTKAKFKKSKAYKKIKWFKKYVSYSKSFVMAGMKNTNVAGFHNTTMCPQGLTFAGSYLLMSAYDYYGEDNTVIYVMSKSKRKLLTTIVLPDDVHAGGLAYDGKNVWVCHGGNIEAIDFAQIKAAAKAKEPYREVEYKAECAVKTTASFLTYYKGKLYVGKNVEQGKSDMYSYTIQNKDTTPTITLDQSFTIPNRVQGIAFMSNGNMVLSRSNLYTKKMNYYLSQLDYYKPSWNGDSIKSFGKVKNKCAMPSMNEGIAINGSYIYVCYESVIFSTADQQMDRICAFKTSALKKKK